MQVAALAESAATCMARHHCIGLGVNLFDATHLYIISDGMSFALPMTLQRGSH